eukprot:1579056-Amphidinium_carterae.1
MFGSSTCSPEVVLEAVQCTGRALQFVDSALQGDSEVLHVKTPCPKWCASFGFWGMARGQWEVLRETR